MNKNKPVVMLGLSGGVDSSVSAFLLKEAGYHVQAVFMRNWHDTKDCPQLIDEADARSICDQLQIELKTISFADEYWQFVFSHFLSEFKIGRTPNPDILCNQEIKFKAFLNYARNHQADFIATGHYVQKNVTNEAIQLIKGVDADKDQSYFLHKLSREQLKDALFPVGGLAKSEVRTLAKQLNLKTFNKKDSTGICFIGEVKFKAFLQEYLPAKPGSIETLAGEVIGQHDGLMFYTIGQRQGLNIGGLKGKAEAPWYVQAKDVARNVLTVVQDNNHPALYRDSLLAEEIHWINQPPLMEMPLSAKIRYRQRDQGCKIENVADKLRVTFDQPQRAITPGQSIVFYQGDICLGGGIIC